MTTALSYKFAADSSSGLGAFNINLKAFIFQLITFVIVVLVFRRWILPPIMRTLEGRQKAVEKSLADAKATEEALAKAEVRAEDILAKARAQADAALAEAKKAADALIVKAETVGAERSAKIITEAKAQLVLEREKLRRELKAELAELVADATGQMLNEKVDDAHDRKLINRIVGAIR